MLLWEEIFGNEAPVEIEIGPERGTFLLATAALHPERNYFGIERSSNRADRISRALERSARANVRVLCADASCAIAACVPADSVATYHIYFPDPWWKRRHSHRRLLTPDFCAALWRTLEPGGELHLVTDVPELFALAMRSLRTVEAFDEVADVPERPVRSSFEIKAAQCSSPLYTASLRKRIAVPQRRSA